MFSSHVTVRSESSVASGVFFWGAALLPVLALTGVTFWQIIAVSKGISASAAFIDVLPNGFLLLILLLAAALQFSRIFRPARALSKAVQALAGQGILASGKDLPEFLAIKNRLQQVQIDLLNSNRDAEEARKTLSRAEEKSESERQNAQEEIESLKNLQIL